MPVRSKPKPTIGAVHDAMLRYHGDGAPCLLRASRPSYIKGCIALMAIGEKTRCHLPGSHGVHAQPAISVLSSQSGSGGINLWPAAGRINGRPYHHDADQPRAQGSGRSGAGPCRCRCARQLLFQAASQAGLGCEWAIDAEADVKGACGTGQRGSVRGLTRDLMFRHRSAHILSG